MIQYFFAAILLVGVLFLLYCLWNFARELKPRRSTVVVSSCSALTRTGAVAITNFRTQPQVVRLQEQSRSVPRPANASNFVAQK
jgi:glucan phosphoethanolaminetransferase (alkaline phosphatase superfamily)